MPFRLQDETSLPPDVEPQMECKRGISRGSVASEGTCNADNEGLRDCYGGKGLQVHWGHPRVAKGRLHRGAGNKRSSTARSLFSYA